MPEARESQFAIMIDATEFNTILRYYDSPTSDIRQVVLVDKSISLARFAAAYSTLSDVPKSGKQMSHWAQNFLFLTLSDGSPNEQNFARADIEPSQRMKCIFYPPVYLIQSS